VVGLLRFSEHHRLLITCSCGQVFVSHGVGVGRLSVGNNFFVAEIVLFCFWLLGGGWGSYTKKFGFFIKFENLDVAEVRKERSPVNQAVNHCTQQTHTHTRVFTVLKTCLWQVKALVWVVSVVPMDNAGVRLNYCSNYNAKASKKQKVKQGNYNLNL